MKWYRKVVLWIKRTKRTASNLNRVKGPNFSYSRLHQKKTQFLRERNPGPLGVCILYHKNIIVFLSSQRERESRERERRERGERERARASPKTHDAQGAGSFDKFSSETRHYTDYISLMFGVARRVLISGSVTRITPCTKTDVTNSNGILYVQKAGIP